MKLRDARLCIDCDEVYEAAGAAAQCPSCGAQAFAFLSRWVPTVAEFEQRLTEMREAEGVAAPSAR